MTSMSKLIEEIIDELERLNGLTFIARLEEDGKISLPRIIDAGNGGSLHINKIIDDNISRVASILMENDPHRKLQFTDADWRADVRRAFGPALASIDLEVDNSVNAKVVINEVNKTLNQNMTSKSEKEHAFGCTLLSGVSIDPFFIGPVRFETRQDWLNRKHLEKCISRTSKRRIESAWRGIKLTKRKSSFDSISETNVLDAIGNEPYVCTVKTKNLANSAGLDKALTAAHLAMVAVALNWQSPSKALNGINLIYDGPPYPKRTLSCTPGQRLLGGISRSHLPFGPRINMEDWKVICSEQSGVFSVVGEVIEYVVSPTGAVARPQMASALAHALLWFYEGCRDSNSNMAIVNFAACLDALACGGKAGGICRLINARIGIKNDDPINKTGGPTLKKAIERIYGKGRSRTIHGNNDELAHDWSETEALAEQFGRLCLLECLEWAAKKPNSDSPKSFQA